VQLLVILETFALVAAAWVMWRRSRTATPSHARAFWGVILALALYVISNVLAAEVLNRLAGAGLNRPATVLLLMQAVRCLLLAWAVWCWLLVVRPRLKRSWRGVMILLAFILVVLLPDAAAGGIVLMILPLLRLRWTRNIHGWSRFGLTIALAVLTIAMWLRSDATLSEGTARIDVVMGAASPLTETDGELPALASAMVTLAAPWEHAIQAMLVLIRLQVALAFLQLLVVPIRLRGLSIKRRFTVTLAMFRFIPGTLGLIFIALVAYLGIGLHRASVIQHTFDATLERCLQAADALLDSSTSGARIPARDATVAGEPAYAVVRDLEWVTVPPDSNGEGRQEWEARVRSWSPGTPGQVLETNLFAEIDADSSIGLAETEGLLFLRAARIRRDGDRGVGTEVYVAVDSTYLAALARRLQSDVRVDVSARVYIGEGNVEVVGREAGGWTDSSFTITAPFQREVITDDFWERRYYLARTFLPVGNWLDELGDNRIGAVQLQLYTTLRGLWQSLTSNPIILTSQLLAVVILAGIALLFFIVELSAVRTGRSIIKGIVSDLNTLTVSARKFGEGDLAHRVELSGKDEMGQLAATFNSMAANIETHQEVLLEKERLEADLSVARDIQQRMLPQSPPLIPGLDVAGLSIPSREVGGDLFYFLPVSGGRLGLTIGDVSGKSVPAALLMSNVLAALKSEARIVDAEDEILAHLNRLIVEQVEPGRFVTFFYGVVDPTRHALRYACAGHNPPLVMSADGTARWLEEAGVPLGVMAESTYASVEAALEPGDVLILYSDGVTEAQRASIAGDGDSDDDSDEPGEDTEFFDERRLETAAREARGRPASAIVAHIMDSIRAFTDGAEQSDDVTLVVVRMTAEE
jgi:serine phosphatase RsbU (regulator of sigma subunit)